MKATIDVTDRDDAGTAVGASRIAPLLRAVADVLQLQVPLAALDLESTGTNAEIDRIVEITIGRVDSAEGDDSAYQTLSTRVQPGVSIPPEASAIHGITDAMVTGAPSFGAIASRVRQLLAGAALVGFHHRRFDIRLLAAEYRRAEPSAPSPCEGARLVDVGLIFMKREPRTLEAALEFYCHESHEDAHGTAADVVATIRVLLAQFARYPDLPRDLDALDALGRNASSIDRDGKIVWRNGEACIAFGKNTGIPLAKVDRGFLFWMLDKDFAHDTKAIVRRALRGDYPLPIVVPCGDVDT